MAQADHFECNSSVKAFLPRAVNDALATPTNFLQQFVIAEVSQDLWGARSAVLGRDAALRRPVVAARRLYLVAEQTKAHLQETSRANMSRCVIGDSCSAFSANGGGDLHLMGWLSAS